VVAVGELAATGVTGMGVPKWLGSGATDRWAAPTFLFSKNFKPIPVPRKIMNNSELTEEIEQLSFWVKFQN
jgi:hypothetical protein